jgi:type VI secretion system secreted protein Hcp
MPIFMQFDPAIKGEATAKGFEGQIDIESFSWGLTQTGSLASGGGGGAGKASFQDIHFEMPVSSASPLLAKNCATGARIDSATLTVHKALGDYYTIKMTDVLISSYQSAGAGDERPEESFSLNFAKIEFDYRAQKADGSLDEPIVFTFDILANKTG